MKHHDINPGDILQTVAPRRPRQWKVYNNGGDTIDISDGYHTFSELYEHRCALFAYLAISRPDCAVWTKDPATPGWFVVLYIISVLKPDGEPLGRQISYHLPEEKYGMLQKVLREAPPTVWDGHTSAQVIERFDEVFQTFFSAVAGGAEFEVLGADA